MEDHPDHMTYKQARAQYAKHIQESKAAHWAKWLEDISKTDMWSASWFITRLLTDGSRPRDPTL